MSQKSGSRLVWTGGTMIGALALLGFFAPWLTQHDPSAILLRERLLGPSWQHLMGTDQNGLDIFAQILYGARVSLTIALSVVSISLSIGLLIGSIAGYCGGWVDMLIMRIIDMIYAFPGFLLILTIAAVMQSSSLGQLIFILCLTGWTSYARLVRGEVLHLKKKDYVISAEAMGASHGRKMILYIWPNLLGPVTIQASFGMAVTILTESSLSFLGLGVPPGTPTWGGLLNSGRNYLLEAPHLSLFPGLALLLVVLGFNLLGDGLRERLDPKNS